MGPTATTTSITKQLIGGDDTRVSQNLAIFALVFNGRGRHGDGRVELLAVVARRGRGRSEHRQRRGIDHLLLLLLLLLRIVGGRWRRMP